MNKIHKGIEGFNETKPLIGISLISLWGNDSQVD